MGNYFYPRQKTISFTSVKFLIHNLDTLARYYNICVPFVNNYNSNFAIKSIVNMICLKYKNEEFWFEKQNLLKLYQFLPNYLSGQGLEKYQQFQKLMKDLAATFFRSIINKPIDFLAEDIYLAAQALKALPNKTHISDVIGGLGIFSNVISATVSCNSSTLHQESIQYLSVNLLSIVDLYNQSAELLKARNAQIDIKDIIQSAMLIRLSTSFFWLEGRDGLKKLYHSLIDNIEKILAINSQPVEVIEWDWDNDYYQFTFEYDNIHSTTFKVHMNRKPESGHKYSYTMKLWDGINPTPLEYNFGLHDVKDPFTLLKYLNDVVFDWNVVTNK
jgi:hypothetical protein